mgnify:CR=1 FL=1
MCKVENECFLRFSIYVQDHVDYFVVLVQSELESPDDVGGEEARRRKEKKLDVAEEQI